MPETAREKVCILGAAGFIGRHVVSECLTRGYRVAAIDAADGRQTGMVQHRRLDFHCGHLSDLDFVARAMEGAAFVVCLAPNSLPATSNENMGREIGDQVQTTVRLAEMAQALGVGGFVFASSGGTVYGQDSPTPLAETAPTQPRNAYGVSKLAIEHYLRVLRDLRGLRTVSLRISNPYGAGQNAGNGQGFIAMAMRRAFGGEPMSIWGDGKAVRDFIYVKDLAEAIVLAGSYRGEHPVINIGSGLGYSLLEVAAMVEEISGRPLRLRFEQTRQIDVAKNVLDISLALRELGWEPRTSLEAGIAQTSAWWAARHIAQGH